MSNAPLDSHELADWEGWQADNFDRALARVVSILTHFLEVDIPQAMRFLSYDDDRATGMHTHAEVAANISGMLFQAVTNCDLRGLNHAAHDLAVTKQNRIALARLKVSLPEVVAQAMEHAEDERKAGRSAKELAEREARAKRDREQCTATVYRGRGPSGRCQNKATGLDAEGNKKCRQHGGVNTAEDLS